MSEGERYYNFYWGIDAISTLRTLWPRDWPTCFNHGCVYSPLYCTFRFTAFYQSPPDAIFRNIICCKSTVCTSHDDLALSAQDRRIFMNPNWNLLECLAVCLLNRKPSHQLAFLSDLASVSLQQSHWSQHLFNKTNAITSSGVRLENKTNATIAKNKVWIFLQPCRQLLRLFGFGKMSIECKIQNDSESLEKNLQHLVHFCSRIDNGGVRSSFTRKSLMKSRLKSRLIIWLRFRLTTRGAN